MSELVFFFYKYCLKRFTLNLLLKLVNIYQLTTFDPEWQKQQNLTQTFTITFEIGSWDNTSKPKLNPVLPTLVMNPLLTPTTNDAVGESSIYLTYFNKNYIYYQLSGSSYVFQEFFRIFFLRPVNR